MEVKKGILHESQVSGILQEPIIKPLSFGIGLTTTYHWVTRDKKDIYLYLSITKDPKENTAIARVNIDSGQVKGQGDALWGFLTEKIQEYSNKGLSGDVPLTIIHEVDTNEYSSRLPSMDPRYKQSKDKSKFYGLYIPEVPEE